MLEDGGVEVCVALEGRGSVGGGEDVVDFDRGDGEGGRLVWGLEDGACYAIVAF